ncbi:hypothetical protein GURASL_06190 [Geotalea uraniireducens]|uniref:Uncharacterized protein n=1 Tax=Geotalea uraniireducens TaxID=351604 RepID=A0ABM8EGY5_9BACT|nr:hypothetical protein [Geotalea uraniireducens]BDV41696.1 hypothetical protein GURASL_06190 [Geotalea uraniireducens]
MKQALLLLVALVCLVPSPPVVRAGEAPTGSPPGEGRVLAPREKDPAAAQLLPREDVAASPAVAVPPAEPEKVKPRGYGQYEKVLIYDSSEGGHVETLPR